GWLSSTWSNRRSGGRRSYSPPSRAWQSDLSADVSQGTLLPLQGEGRDRDGRPRRRTPRIAGLLESRQCQAIVATDYIRAYPEQVRAYVPTPCTVLGTDGYGRSDTRANLRRHFEVDRYYVAQAAITALAAEGKMTAKDVSRAIKLYEIDTDKPYPLCA